MSEHASLQNQTVLHVSHEAEEVLVEWASLLGKLYAVKDKAERRHLAEEIIADSVASFIGASATYSGRES